MRRWILLGCFAFILCFCAGCGQEESQPDPGLEEEDERYQPLNQRTQHK